MTRAVLSTLVLIFASIATSLPSRNTAAINDASSQDPTNPSDVVDEMPSMLQTLGQTVGFIAGAGIKSLEWTALGDSYAAGVGSGAYVDGRRCLRFSEAYPIIMNNNPGWTRLGNIPAGIGDTHKLNNVVCSGAEIQDIIDYQLLDEPASSAPNFQFGNVIPHPCCINYSLSS
jgi:hypothetical protein